MRNILTAICLTISISAISQNYPEQFKLLGQKKDSTAQLKLLSSWEKASPKDPELYIAWFNYYAQRSAMELVTLEGSPQKENAFTLTDSAGNQVGFVNTAASYNPAIMQKGFPYIDKGIVLHPTRLDMRFGKIHMLGELQNWDEFTKEVIKTIDYADKIKYAWLWSEGKPAQNAREMFLASMHEYATTIYNTENDELLPQMRQITEAVLKYNPNHIESLSNLALTYLVVGDYDKGLPYLLKAEKVNPKDVIVLNNIAEVYKRKEDKVNAKLYFEKMLLYGNEEDKTYAKAQISSL